MNNNTDYGEVIYNGKTIVLTEDAYPWEQYATVIGFQAHGIYKGETDEDGNEIRVLVSWYYTDEFAALDAAYHEFCADGENYPSDFDGIDWLEDAENACDWDSPDEVELAD